MRTTTMMVRWLAFAALATAFAPLSGCVLEGSNEQVSEVVGTIELGSVCASDEDCERDSFCLPTHGEVSFVCSGVCAEKYPEGSACQRTLECAAGQICDRNVCVRVRALGEACTADDYCEDGSECAEASGTCEKPGPGMRQLGEECETERCAEGLSCVLESFSAPHRCRAQVESGEKCFQGYPSQCPPSETCIFSEQGLGLSGNCQPEKAVGEPCSDGQGCALPNVCIADVCVERKPEGAPCGHNLECFTMICAAGRCGSEAAPSCVREDPLG